MRVAEIMNPWIECVLPDASLAAAARKMRDLNIGSLPVVDNGVLVGIVTDRDICCRGLAGTKQADAVRVGTIMSTDVTICFDDQEIAEAARIMEERHVRRLAVLNRARKIIGLLSVDDLAHCSHELAGEVLAATCPIH